MLQNEMPAASPFEIVGTLLEGVRFHFLECHADARGSFTEYFSADWRETGLDPRQWSVVHSRRGTLRGMHVHRDHDEYFAMIRGHAWVGLYDLRPGSPTEHQSMLVEMDGDEPSYLIFPRGIAHGWYFRDSAIHLQAVSSTYQEYHPHDNLGCRWDDPELNIPWPDRPSRVSERAQAFPTLRELTAQVLAADPQFRFPGSA